MVYTSFLLTHFVWMLVVSPSFIHADEQFDFSQHFPVAVPVQTSMVRLMNRGRTLRADKNPKSFPLWAYMLENRGFDERGKFPSVLRSCWRVAKSKSILLTAIYKRRNFCKSCFSEKCLVKTKKRPFIAQTLLCL